jgi:hypothetical protein
MPTIRTNERKLSMMIGKIIDVSDEETDITSIAKKASKIYPQENLLRLKRVAARILREKYGE